MKSTSQLGRTPNFVEEPLLLTQLPKSYSWLTKLWLSVYSFIEDVFSLYSEPHIREIVDCQGVPYWIVYDPASNTHFRFDSMNEIMVWLEKRYYNHQKERNWQ